MDKETLTHYLRNTYNVEPDHPWMSNPSYAVFRHSADRKWFALIMDVPAKSFFAKCGTPEERNQQQQNPHMINIVNLKCDQELISTVIGNKNVYPAYHMNKGNWLSIVLDDNTDEEQLKVLLDMSYRLTRSTKKKQKDKTTSQHVTHPLDPVFDAHSRVLILGTMPSPKSRELGFYYGHPQNRFWKVMAALFDEMEPYTNEEKRTFALEHGIALWDVLAACTIQGAADGTITDCIPNDIARITEHAPIQAIFCTGTKATELYRKYCEETVGLPGQKLPSTSPANARFTLEHLIEAYQPLLAYARA